MTHINEQAATLWRKKPGELVGRNVWSLFPGASELKFHSEYKRALRERSAVEFEEFYPPLNAWFEVHAYPSEIGLSVYFRDISERKMAEHAVRQNEARFQSIVANAPGMVYQFVSHPDGTSDIPFVNEGCRRLFEMTPDEIRGNASVFMERIHPDDLTSWRESMAQSARALLPWDWEGRVVLRSGKTKWVQGAARPRRLENGATLWDAMLADITERKHAEEERDRFFTLSLDMLCIMDARGFFRRFNPAFGETLGFSVGELAPRSLLDFVHPDDQITTRGALQHLRSEGSTQQFVNRFQCNDGSYKWLSWRSTPYEGLNYAAARDITALKQAEDELQRANAELELRVAQRTAELAQTNVELHLEMSERQHAVEAQRESYSLLQAVIEGSTDSIFVKDLEGRYLMINSAGAEFRGALAQEVIGKTDRDFFSSATAHTFRDSDLRILRSGITQTYEQSIVESGKRKTLLVTKGIHRNPQGETIGIVGMARDITERQEQADALHAAKLEADAANRAKSEFLSRMSHELRTPLNAILGFGQILEMHPLESEERAAVTQILKGGWHLLNLVNEVLEISRVEAGHLELLLEPIALSAVVRESCDLVRPLAEQREVHLEENALHLCPHHVMADPQRLKQVLINLLSNAIKYNVFGGRVEVLCEPRPDERIRISVRDTGPGLSVRDCEKLFTPFEGSGLGLALSQGMIRAMGGIIGVESAENKGSTFWIELPEVAAPVEETFPVRESMEHHTSAPDGRTFSVLSIEDNLSNLWLLEAILARRPEILLMPAMQDLARQHLPDLVLLDLNLPDMTGAQVLEQLQNTPETASIPVIVISADAMPSQIERLMRAGARDYLTKPINVAQFLHTLNEALGLTTPAPSTSALSVAAPSKEVKPKAQQNDSSRSVDNADKPALSLPILVVEDSPVNQPVVLHQLQNPGHEAKVVESGEAALAALGSGTFALVLLDCHLPGMSGYETARTIRRGESEDRHIPIIALTATGSDRDRHQCFAAGMDDYLSKPVKANELAAALARAVAPLSDPVTVEDAVQKERQVLDRERLQELQSELDPSLVRELAALFFQETQQFLVALSDAEANEDFAHIGQMAHKSKGSCATLGLAIMRKLCHDLEDAVTAREKERVRSIIERLHLEFQTARAALQDELAL